MRLGKSHSKRIRPGKKRANFMNCKTCGEKAGKRGKSKSGLQRFFCCKCRKAFTEPHALANKKTSVEDAAKVLRMLLEGMSIRSCQRLTGMDRNTIMGIMLAAGESCRAFMEKTVRRVPAQTIELDEQWSFIFCKAKTADARGYTEECGDNYVFTAIDRETKLLLCWHTGLRSADDTYHFAHKLYLAVDGRPSINTDGFKPYTAAIPLTFRHQCDYAQIVKHFQNSRDGQQRYSPGSIIRAEKKVVCGDVPQHEIGTSRMERFNLTTRMTVRRFTRLTNAHSKKRRHHEAMLGLYFAWYNWVRKHSTIKTTPAVAAKLADEPWTLEKLLTVAAAA